MKFSLIALLFFSTLTVFAGNKDDKAKVKGIVYENVRGYKLPLSLATIQCKGTTIGTFSEKTGDFELDLPKGEYKVTFAYVGYEPVIKELKIKKNKEIYLEVTLEESDQISQNNL
jgi:hypothetical protein